MKHGPRSGNHVCHVCGLCLLEQPPLFSLSASPDEKVEPLSAEVIISPSVHTQPEKSVKFISAAGRDKPS